MRTPSRVASVLGLVLALGACRTGGSPANQPDPELRRDLDLTAAQAEYLERLVVDAEGHPTDFEKQKASGMAHLRYTLSGVLSLQQTAERNLENAFALNQSDDELNFALGRFYNLRAVGGDDSKSEMQVRVYGALLGDQAPSAMDTRQFVGWSFFQLGVILSHRTQGRLLKALSVVEDLEDELDRRARAEPDDIELWALAGNFSFFFAGNIPFGKEARVKAAVEYFEHVREHWEELRIGAKDPEHCPNTYENFMFELAEGHVVLGQLDKARPIYEELAVPNEPVTRAKEQIAFVSAERLRNADHYAGEMALMPPWPSDVGNCVVCHAYTADVPLTTLHSRQPIRLSDIPTSAVTKPVHALGSVPKSVREVVDRRCGTCHSPGGEASSYVDFSTDAAVAAHAAAIARRVEASEMPPDQDLDPADRKVLLEWAGSDSHRR